MIVDLKDLKINQLKKALNQGEIIIFPSDGTYMIGCNVEYVNSVDNIKDLGFNIVIPASKQWITKNFKSKKNYIKEIPGPFVYIFDLKKTNELDTNFGVAIPKHKITSKLQKTGKVIFASVLGLRNIRSINRRVKNMADLIIDDGFLEDQNFMVIDLRQKIARIVR